MKPPKAVQYNEALVFRAVELLFAKRGEDSARLRMKEIADQLNKEFGPNPKVTRETLYPLAEEAVRRGFVHLTPPISQALREELVGRFPDLRGAEVDVVKTSGRRDTVKVAAVAAERAFDAVVRIARTKGSQPVGIGLGPGRATLEFCRILSERLEAHHEQLRLRLVAITAGCPVRLLENAPISFLNLFPERLVESKLGLFAETLVPAGEFKRLHSHTGIKDAFAAKKDIDLVVTAMGDFDDPHDLLSLFLKDSGQDLAELRRRGWLGNVQYRPFTATGPVKEGPRELRAVTVFELADLVDLARNPDKAVILMARQCGLCPRPRAGALLSHPSLKVFSRLVLDQATATELLKTEVESPPSKV